MMNLGALATVASARPDNLSIICMDNGLHGETGGQLGHTSRGSNLAIIAQGAGLPSVLTITETEELVDGATFLTDASSSRFLVVKIKAGPPSIYNRNMDLAACRMKFQSAYLTSAYAPSS